MANLTFHLESLEGLQPLFGCDDRVALESTIKLSLALVVK